MNMSAAETLAKIIIANYENPMERNAIDIPAQVVAAEHRRDHSDCPVWSPCDASSVPILRRIFG